MKYHVTLARNDVFGELAASRFPCSLDDFNRPCTVVIVKKKNWHAKFLYSTCNLFTNLFLSESI